MSEKRFTFDREVEFEIYDNVTKKSYDGTIGCQEKICQLLNKLAEENRQLLKEKDYWKKQAMTLLMQVRRLTPRMTDEEVNEFSKELEDGDGV